jgi:hypothetical protein
MRKFVRAAVTAGALAVAALGPAATATANADGADVVVSNLRNQGYNVKVLGTGDNPSPQCSVTGIHPDPKNLDQSASFQEKQHTLVEVDVSCP